MGPGDTYTHGHHPSVLRSHEWRTAENSASYLLGRLLPGQRLLDVGCGPGSITLDLAERVAPGSVVGIDASGEVIARAQAAARDQMPGASIRFAQGDVYALDDADHSYDVVHAHQVLQHLTDPVAALQEMRRVLVPGGTLAVRDSDYGGFVWAPADARLTRWMELYHLVTARNGAEADAGRHLASWVRAAGFTDLRISSSTWTFADDATRQWWGGLWAERTEQSSFADQAVAQGHCERGELAKLADAWTRWAGDEEGFFAVLHVEVLATP